MVYYRGGKILSVQKISELVEMGVCLEFTIYSFEKLCLEQCTV